MRRTLGVKAIRVYIPELLKEVDSSIERDENPSILVKKIVRRSPGRENLPEIELVFKGSRHLEDLRYYSKDPSTWITWGEIYLSPRQALKLAQALIEAVLAKPQREIINLVDVYG